MHPSDSMPSRGEADSTEFRPLEGIRVIDLTGSIAGPWCSQILGALGADVIKVEHPIRGDDTRSWGPPFFGDESATFLAVNANKRSIGVDLKSDAGRDLILRLSRDADVFVQNLRPGLCEELGLGYEELTGVNPTIVYCSVSAFGSVGPLREQPGYDPLMQAFAGLMSITGNPGDPPVRNGVSVVDQGTGMWAVIGILAALRARELGAGPQLVETSLYEAALNWLPYQLLGYVATKIVPEPAGSGIAMIAPYESFQTADRWIMVAAGNDRLFQSLCRALALPDLADDSRFRTNADRVAKRAALHEALATRFLAETSATWLAALAAVGIPAAPVQGLDAVVGHPQTAALGILQELPDVGLHEPGLVAPPLSVDGRRVRHSRSAPSLSEDSREILRDLGLTDADIAEMAHAGVIALADRSDRELTSAGRGAQ